jgi:FkbM family methyltransferase
MIFRPVSLGVNPYQKMDTSDHTVIDEHGLKFKIRKHPKIEFQGKKGWPSDRFAIYQVFSRGIYRGEPEFDLGGADVIFDVGAHVGAFTVYAAQENDESEIYAFEPFPESYGLLEENVQLNDFDSRVETYEKAVTAEDCENYRLYLDKENTCRHGQIQRDETSQFAETESITLESVFQKQDLDSCDFMKMNCEGAEEEILLGTPRAVFERIERLVFEYHERDDEDGTLEEILEYLRSTGFDISIDQRNPKSELTKLIGPNYPLVFCQR